VETKFINSAAAKLKFEYRMFESTSKALVATGSSLQVFVDAKTFELLLTMPLFFEAWKKKWSLK
jgi:acyl-CoA thioester hydrolase